MLPGPALVGHLDLQGERLVAEPDPRPRAPGVLERVGQGLLDDPVGGELQAGVKGPWRPIHGQFDRETGAADLLDELAESLEARDRRAGVVAASRRPGRVAQHAQHPPHVGQRLATGPVDGLERRAHALRPPVERGQSGAGLDHDHADMMRDDVVELAGDPLALVLDRAARSLLALGLLQPGVLLDRRGVLAPGPRPVPEGEDDDDREHRLDGPGDGHLGAGLAHDDPEERDRDRHGRDDRDAPGIALGDREERHERPEALVDDLALDERRMEGGRGQRDDEDRDRPPPADDQRERLEQEQREAEGIALARVRRAAGHRQQRQRREAEGDRDVDEPRDHGARGAAGGRHAPKPRGPERRRHHAQGGHAATTRG